ncbi:MAG TPA: hypothetical protein VFD55_02885 [Candidatus Angelobacter sp.]|nr:hypothetical protein [Candidatus Angelobacter sp.]
MKKSISSIIVMTIIFSSVATFVSAQQSSTGSGNGNNGVETQTQTQTANQGEETQIQVSQEIQTMVNDSRAVYTAENPTAKQGLTGTNIAAEEIIKLSANVQTQDAELATQIQSTVKAQTQAMDKISENIDKIDDRNGFVKFMIGANYGQIKEANQQMEQNRQRVEELNQIKSQVQNSSDATELQKQIDVLEFQNTTFQNQVDQSGDGFSLFGWLFKWING